MIDTGFARSWIAFIVSELAEERSPLLEGSWRGGKCMSSLCRRRVEKIALTIGKNEDPALVDSRWCRVLFVPPDEGNLPVLIVSKDTPGEGPSASMFQWAFRAPSRELNFLRHPSGVDCGKVDGRPALDADKRRNPCRMELRCDSRHLGIRRYHNISHLSAKTIRGSKASSDPFAWIDRDQVHTTHFRRARAARAGGDWSLTAYLLLHGRPTSPPRTGGPRP